MSPEGDSSVGKTVRPHLILLVKDGEARSMYESAILSMGVTLDIASTVTQMQTTLVDQPASGLVLDIPAMLRANRAEKALVHDLLEIYPVVRVQWDARSRTIRSLYYGQAGAEERGLESFVRDKCLPFASRKLRKQQRTEVNLRLMLAREGGGFPAEAVRTVTLNVSEGGCFIYTIEEWQTGDRVRLRFRGLDDLRPWSAVVRWWIPWDRDGALPGIGVCFRAPRRERLERLIEMARNKALLP